jgi:polyisoprenoid-binding protein YceI
MDTMQVWKTVFVLGKKSKESKKFLKLKLMLVLVFFGVFTSFSQELIQNDSKTAITFKIKNFGLYVDGHFSDIVFKSNFNSSYLKESFLNAEIGVESIFTDSKLMKEHLLKSDFFDVNTYPKMVFTSTEIIKKETSKYVIKGILVIKGVKKEFEVPLEIKETKNEIVFLANFILNRKDFGVGGSSMVLSKKVAIKMMYVATKN